MSLQRTSPYHMPPWKVRNIIDSKVPARKGDIIISWTLPSPKLGIVVQASIFMDKLLVGGFKYFLFSPLPEEMIQFDYIIFFKWVETTN